MGAPSECVPRSRFCSQLGLRFFMTVLDVPSVTSAPNAKTACHRPGHASRSEAMAPRRAVPGGESTRASAHMSGSRAHNCAMAVPAAAPAAPRRGLVAALVVPCALAFVAGLLFL